MPHQVKKQLSGVAGFADCSKVTNLSEKSNPDVVQSASSSYDLRQHWSGASSPVSPSCTRWRLYVGCNQCFPLQPPRFTSQGFKTDTVPHTPPHTEIGQTMQRFPFPYRFLFASNNRIISLFVYVILPFISVCIFKRLEFNSSCWVS